MDDTQDSVVEQVAPEGNQPESQVVQPPKEENRHFKAMREKQRQLERELDEARRMNEQLKQAQVPPQPDELDSLSDDEYLNKGKVQKLVQKKAKEIAQQEVQNILKEQEKSQFMNRLETKYPDFKDVVTLETMALLEQTEPELAKAIVATNDPYVIGLQTYKYVKALKLEDKVPASRRAKEIDKKLEDNSKTVVTPQAYDKRPMAKAYQLTQSDLKDLYKEMTNYASQAGYGY